MPDAVEGYNRYGLPGQPYNQYGSTVGDTSQQTVGGSSTISTGTTTAHTTPIKPDAGIIDTYIYCDSNYKDPSSNLAAGTLVFDIASLNNNQPVNNVIEMEIAEFFIPVVDNFPLDLPVPQTFFYRRNTLFIQELSTQSYFGPNQNRFHWEVDVAPAGIANSVTPIQPKFIFGRPIRDITKITLVIKSPLTAVAFPNDSYVAVAIPGTGSSDSNPLQFQLGYTSIGTSNSVVTVTPAPTASLTATNITGTGALSAGTYLYVVTFVSSAGESYAGPASAAVTAAATSYNQLSLIPTSPTGATSRNIYRTRANGGSYLLAATINDNSTTSYNDTLADTSLGTTFSFVAQFSTASFMPPPATPLTPTNAAAGGGQLGAGYYYYAVTYVTSAGETNGGPIIYCASVATSTDTLTNIPIGPSGVLYRNIYRSTVQSSNLITPPLYFLTTISDNVTVVYVDNLSDVSLVVRPPGGTLEPTLSSDNSTGSAISTGLNNSAFVAPPTSALTATNVSDPNGLLSSGSYQYVVTYVNAAGETGPGPASTAITSTSPSYNSLTNIPVAPSSAGVIARKVYRNVANGTTYKLVLYVNDNTTTSLVGITFADNYPDTSLTSPISNYNTTGDSEYSVYITGFNSTSLGIPSNIDPVVNRGQGHLVTVTGNSTIALSNSPTANLPGGIPYGAAITCVVFIAYRRIAIPFRFRQLVGGDTNRILPV